MSPKWRNLVQNLVWYIGALIIVLLLVRLLRSVPVILLLGLLVSAWGMFLVDKMVNLGVGLYQREIIDERLESYLLQARGYEADFLDFIRHNDSQTRHQLTTHTRLVGRWARLVEALVRRIDALQQDSTIQQNVHTVPQVIASLESRLNQEKDPSARARLNQVLTNHRQQWRALRTLRNKLRDAEKLVEQAVVRFSREYQNLVNPRTNAVSSLSKRRLKAQLSADIGLLENHLQTLHDVHLVKRRS